jgi:hypothetical protein
MERPINHFQLNLSKLLLIHGIITLAAGIVLVASPTLIPGTVNIQITSNQYLLCYFLGAAEFALAYLSFFSRNIKDTQVLRLVSSTFIVFHSITALLELYAFIRGTDPKILGNIAVRVLIVILFIYYGNYKSASHNN